MALSCNRSTFIFLWPISLSDVINWKCYHIINIGRFSEISPKALEFFARISGIFLRWVLWLFVYQFAAQKTLFKRWSEWFVYKLEIHTYEIPMNKIWMGSKTCSFQTNRALWFIVIPYQNCFHVNQTLCYASRCTCYSPHLSELLFCHGKIFRELVGESITNLVLMNWRFKTYGFFILILHQSWNVIPGSFSIGCFY